MKQLLLIVASLVFGGQTLFAQTHDILGIVTDSRKTKLPGVTLKLAVNNADTTVASTDAGGRFRFSKIKGEYVSLFVSAVGYQGLVRFYPLFKIQKEMITDTIVLTPEIKQLDQVNVTGVKPVVLKEDTIEYKAAAYKVRDQAPVEELIKKLPGVEVDQAGNVTAQGKPVTKVRVNGKDFFDGDVQAATKNLPADLVDKIQIIDDYGDRASITGLKTGDPTKLMNIVIKADKNNGYTGQATLGGGHDALPKEQVTAGDYRYAGLASVFDFKGERQTSVLGNLNNTNVNAFSFGTPNGPPASADPMVNKKLALESAINAGKSPGGGGGNFVGQSSIQNGITETRALGINFRDQWGKHLSSYGSYSFGNSQVFTKTNTFQQNTSLTQPQHSEQLIADTRTTTNHRLNWNLEYKPDAANYLKVSPSLSFLHSKATMTGGLNAFRNAMLSDAYNFKTTSRSTLPLYGLSAVYNHRFTKPGRNFGIDLDLNSTRNNTDQNPVYQITAGNSAVPVNQQIHTGSRTQGYSASLAYMEPVGPKSYLEINYAFNRNVTATEKETNVLDTASQNWYREPSLSNNYHYTFTTHRVGLNFRHADKNKYNYTFGLSLQPTALKGQAPEVSLQTRVSGFNVIPNAHFSYYFSQNKTLSFHYSGVSSQPEFAQLQPVTDLSNALYPVQGNPGLKPSFTHSLNLQYNQFSFESGRILFGTISFSKTQNQVTPNTVIYPSSYSPDPRLASTYLTRYANTDGFYNASGFISYAYPWAERKFTLLLNSTLNYLHNPGYITQVDSVSFQEKTLKNTATTWLVIPAVRFRADLPNVVDAQFVASYTTNKTRNTAGNELVNASANIKTWNLGISGKNYLRDWTISYDLNKVFTAGYAGSLRTTNPSVLNMYVERRFLKENKGTIRLAAFDLLNQNTGYATNSTASYIVQTRVNRLGRYFLATFTIRFQKFGNR